MDWSERMNAAIEDIEANLAAKVDIGRAAEKACCSLYHFQRMFFAVTGTTPAEYVRRRRLTLAATELQTGKSRVLDIALKYGYESPEAFTRAFRNVHGLNPLAAREPGVRLVAYPRISFYVSLQGGTDMDYSISEKPAFTALGVTRRMPSDIYNGFVIDPKVWDRFWYDCWRDYRETDTYRPVRELESGPGSVTGAVRLGITVVDADMKGYTYTIGVEKPEVEAPAGLALVPVPARTWAIFETTGAFPEAIHDLEDRIFRDWFPSTGYEFAPGPELEVYPPGDPASPDYRCRYWFPVVRKTS